MSSALPSIVVLIACLLACGGSSSASYSELYELKETSAIGGRVAAADVELSFYGLLDEKTGAVIASRPESGRQTKRAKRHATTSGGEKTCTIDSCILRSYQGRCVRPSYSAPWFCEGVDSGYVEPNNRDCRAAAFSG